MTTIRFDRLERLAQILHGLTDKDVDLGDWRCGTQACALGWACLEPEFQNQGLSLVGGSPTCTAGPDVAFGYEVAIVFFGLSDSRSVFGMRGDSCFDDEPDAEHLTDRDLAIYRIRQVFENNGRALLLP